MGTQAWVRVRPNASFLVFEVKVASSILAPDIFSNLLMRGVRELSTRPTSGRELSFFLELWLLYSLASSPNNTKKNQIHHNDPTLIITQEPRNNTPPKKVGGRTRTRDLPWIAQMSACVVFAFSSFCFPALLRNRCPSFSITAREIGFETRVRR